MWRNFVEQQTAMQAGSMLGVETTFNWLYSLPDIGIALLFGMVGAGLLAAAPFLREKLLRLQVPSSHSEANKRLLAGDQLHGNRSRVLTRSGEYQFSKPRNAGGYGGPQFISVGSSHHPIWGTPANEITRAALHDYASSIVKDEWPELHKGRSSERTAALFRPISRSILAIAPSAWTPEPDLCGDAQKS